MHKWARHGLFFSVLLARVSLFLSFSLRAHSKGIMVMGMRYGNGFGAVARRFMRC